MTKDTRLRIALGFRDMGEADIVGVSSLPETSFRLPDTSRISVWGIGYRIEVIAIFMCEDNTGND